MFIFLSCVLVFNVFYSLDLVTIINSVHLYVQYDVSFGFFKVPYLDVLGSSLLGAAFIKSAQFGAHV